MSAPRTFQDALAQNPAPEPALGDARLWYDPPVLVGETPLSRTGPLPTAALAVAGALDVVALAAFLLNVPDGALWGLVGLAAAGHLAAAWAEARQKRQRRFICNFADRTLRLDFHTPLSGLPRSLLVDFQGVKAVEVLEDAQGCLALVVDFVPAHATAQTLREVLVARADPAQRPSLERLRGVLRRAFGLEAPEPAAGAPLEGPVDAFVAP